MPRLTRQVTKTH